MLSVSEGASSENSRVISGVSGTRLSGLSTEKGTTKRSATRPQSRQAIQRGERPLMIKRTSSTAPISQDAATLAFNT